MLRLDERYTLALSKMLSRKLITSQKSRKSKFNYFVIFRGALVGDLLRFRSNWNPNGINSSFHNGRILPTWIEIGSILHCIGRSFEFHCSNWTCSFGPIWKCRDCGSFKKGIRCHFCFYIPNCFLPRKYTILFYCTSLKTWSVYLSNDMRHSLKVMLQLLPYSARHLMSFSLSSNKFFSFM